MATYEIDKTSFITYNVNMSELTFEWGQNKERENIKKHCVSFEEARTVFL